LMRLGVSVYNIYYVLWGERMEGAIIEGSVGVWLRVGTLFWT